MECIRFNTEKKYIRDFLKLPKKLYDRQENMENSKEIESILLGKHVLLKYIDSLYKYVIYDEHSEVVARYALISAVISSEGVVM